MTNNIYIVAFFLIGFVLFSLLMDFLQVGLVIEKFLDSSNTRETSTVFLQVEKEKEKENNSVLQPQDSKKPLKLSKEEIGRHSWALLHSIAASFPSLPDEYDQKSMENFLTSLAHIYPCKVCAKHFQELLMNFPIKMKSREELVYYMCDMHNKVNERLGKQIYDCKKSFEIWGSDCGCEVNDK